LDFLARLKQQKKGTKFQTWVPRVSIGRVYWGQQQDN